MKFSMKTIVAQALFGADDVQSTPGQIRELLREFATLSDEEQRELAAESALRLEIPLEDCDWNSPQQTNRWDYQYMVGVRMLSLEQSCEFYLNSFLNHEVPEIRALAGTQLLDLLWLPAPTVSQRLTRQVVAAFEHFQQYEQDMNVRRMIAVHWETLQHSVAKSPRLNLPPANFPHRN